MAYSAFSCATIPANPGGRKHEPTCGSTRSAGHAQGATRGSCSTASTGRSTTVTLNAPQRMNTISGPMLRQLTDALVKAAAEGPGREVRVIVLTAAPAAPSAPGSISRPRARALSISRSARAPRRPTSICATRSPPVLHALDKPVIAALNGSAAGYGLDLAFGADIRVMAQLG